LSAEEASVDWSRLQREWDAQQESYLPDREQRFAAMLDTVDAVAGESPRILDLAGGTGSITRRVLDRFPTASSVVVDVDAALLAIAAGSFAGDDRVRIVPVDLATPAWLETLGETAGSFDAVLTATALHWLPAERVAGVYAEAGTLLRDGGVFANADHMPDDGLTGLSASLTDFSDARHKRTIATTDATDWDGWWIALRAEPELADAVAARDERFAERAGSAHTESTMPSVWHVATLRAAGYTEAGLVWRGLTDAVVVGVR
jgi:SAM-dependent methyltransferase